MKYCLHGLYDWILKKAIKMEKEKSLVAFLEQNDTIPATTAKARRQQAIDILGEQNENK